MSCCPTGFIHYSNYLQQAEGLPVKNGFQQKILQTTDNLTKVRETTKVATVSIIRSQIASRFHRDLLRFLILHQ